MPTAQSGLVHPSDDGWSVAPLDPAHEPAYAALVAQAGASPLSHTLLWRDVLVGLELGMPLYWLAWRAGQLRAALPAFVRRSTLGAVLGSLPFVQSTGGVITPGDAPPSERAQAVTLLVTAMLEWCRAHDVQVASLVGSAFLDSDDALAFPRAPDFQFERTTHALDLREPITPRGSIAWTIRKAERLAPHHRVAATVDEARAVYDVYAANMLRLGAAAHPWELYRRAFQPQSNAGARFVWAEVAGQITSVLILMINGDVVDYYSVGNTDAGRRLQTNTWLCDKEIAHAKEQGARWWNWGASPSAAVYDFKKRWGGHDRRYTISGWCLGDVTAWRRLEPAALSAAFPSYFVLPYDWLSRDQA